ncbi:MAG: hypothetical protein WC764_01465 [Candidatus Paceibacterota bacterium]|jgi:hypothetical protein
MVTTDYPCAIIIASSDGYSDAWEAFFTLFFKYWPDCPYPLYLISSKKVYPDSRVHTITSEQYGDVPAEWGKRIGAAVRSVPGDLFIYMQEDYFLMAPVDTTRIELLVKNFRLLNAVYIKLHPSPAPKKIIDQEMRLGELIRGSDYSISLQTCIWDKKTFLDLLTADITPWKFEFEGSKKTAQYSKKLLSVMQHDSPLPYFATAIKRGRWYYDAVKLCEREGIRLDLTIRPVEPYAAYLRRQIFELPYIGTSLSRIYRRCTALA